MLGIRHSQPRVRISHLRPIARADRLKPTSSPIAFPDLAVIHKVVERYILKARTQLIYLPRLERRGLMYSGMRSTVPMQLLLRKAEAPKHFSMHQDTW